ncbi:MAG: FecR domain-containing protein [Leptospiraceae bacterium]|nr:FecR domain-containing protein [Leptospiraceae bacterium]
MMNPILKIFPVIFLLSLISCEKPETVIIPEDEPKPILAKISAIVVFSLRGEESRVNHTDLTMEKASIGAYFRDGDSLKTGDKSSIDVQIKDEAIFRAKEQSEIYFEEIRKSEGNLYSTKIQVKLGRIYSRVHKSKENQIYEFSTPFMKAEITGTEFIIQSSPDSSELKVLNGEIEISPTIAGMKNLTDSESFKIKEVIESKKIKVGKNKRVFFNKVSDLQLKENLTKEEVDELTKSITAWKPIVRGLRIKKSEEQEIKTLIMESSELTNKMIEINEELTSGQIDEQRIEFLEKKRGELENQIRKKQEEEKKKFNQSIVVVPKKFRNKREIIYYYERVEKIILTRGTVEISAIISQEGDVIILHTEYGIKRIPNEEVVEVIYEYQKKARL